MKILPFMLNFRKQRSIDLLAALLALLLPFSSALPNLLLIPLGIVVLLRFKKIQLPGRRVLALYASAVLALMVLAVFKNSFLEDLNRYSKYILVVVVFFLFAQVKNKKYVEHAFLIGVFVAMLVSSVAIGKHIMANPGFLLDSGSIVNELLLLERPYFGCMLTLSVFLCLKNAGEGSRQYDYYILATVFFAFSIYISARLSMGLIVLLFFIYLFRSTQIHRKTKLFLGLFMAILIAIAMGLSDNLFSRMHVKNDLDKTLHYIEAYEPRFVIWPCASEIAQHEMNLLTGMESYGEMEQKLTQCYAETIENPEKRHYYLDRKFNTHNQFLDFLLIGGLIPFLLLFAMFLWAWFSGAPFEFKLVFLLFFVFFLVENVLHRQLGCYLFGIFAALYSNRTHE